jgi:bifunctional DNA-binding transcriptional regulator/antitoxin component of YhaV-PrlF toxin-antitoxin module
MSRGTFKLIRANGSIVYVTRVTKARRFTFPEPLRELLEAHQLVRITIEKEPEAKK